MSGAISLLPQCAFMAWWSVKKKHRDNFTSGATCAFCRIPPYYGTDSPFHIRISSRLTHSVWFVENCREMTERGLFKWYATHHIHSMWMTSISMLYSSFVAWGVLILGCFQLKPPYVIFRLYFTTLNDVWSWYRIVKYIRT